MFDVMTVNTKEINFGLTNAETEKAMVELATLLCKGESDAHTICKACYNARESATDAKIKDMPWSKYIELQFGARLKSASAMKYALVYGVFGTAETGLFSYMWNNYTVSKLQEIAVLDGKKHKDAGRSIPGFMQYIGERVNAKVAEPYTAWCEANAKQLAIIEKLPKKEREIMMATLPPAPPAPVSDDDAERTEKLQAMGYETVKGWNNSAVREAVAKYVEEHLNTPERSAIAEKEAKKQAKQATKTAEEKRQDAENALTAYLATMEKKPSELCKALTVLQALAPKKEGENE